MAREWLNWPGNIPLVTKLGKIYLSPTSGSHVYATTHPGEGIAAEYLTVNGVMLNVSIHVSKYTDGKGKHRILTHPDIPEPPVEEAYWNLSPGSNGFPSHTSLHATKANWVKYSDSDASSAARKKIEDVVVPAIIGSCYHRLDRSAPRNDGKRGSCGSKQSRLHS